MTQSLLLRRRLTPENWTSNAALILLHAGGGTLDDLVPLAQSLGSGLELVAVEAPRRVHDPGMTTRIYRWFDIQDSCAPEPVTFGDSLAQVEQLIYELSEARSADSRQSFLLGHDQGALLALAISLVLPDYLAGVIAICGCLPRISAWPLPETDLMGMPYLLIYDEEDPDLAPIQVLATADDLRRKRGVPMLQPVTGARALGPGVARPSRDWLGRRNR